MDKFRLHQQRRNLFLYITITMIAQGRYREMKKIYIGYSDFPGFPVREIEWAVSQARRVGADCELVSEPWDGLRKEEWFWNKKPFLLFFTPSTEMAGLMALQMKKSGAQGMAIAWNEDTEKLSDDGFALASICEGARLQTLILKPCLFSLEHIPSWHGDDKTKETDSWQKMSHRNGNRIRKLFFTACILFVKEGNISFLEATDCARKLMHHSSGQAPDA